MHARFVFLCSSALVLAATGARADVATPHAVSLSDCTMTVTFAPSAPPAPGDPATTIPNSARQYVIATYVVVPHGRTGTGVATITAETDIASDMTMLKDERAVFAKTVLACPSRTTTLEDATIGTIATGHAATPGTFVFTLAYGRPRR